MDLDAVSTESGAERSNQGPGWGVMTINRPSTCRTIGRRYQHEKGHRIDCLRPDGQPVRHGRLGPGHAQQRQAEGLPAPAARTPASPASACRTRRATGPASTSISAAPSRRRSSTTRPRFASFRSPPRTASPRSSRAKWTCWPATRPRRCRATRSSASTSRPSTTSTARASWSARSSASSSAKELNGASVCTQQGTTTELNLADYFRANNMKYEVVAFATSDETFKAYDAGRCDAFTTDASGLYAERLRASNSGRPYRPAGDHLQGAARPGSPPWRQPVGRHRPLDAQRHAERRRARRDQGECRPDEDLRQPGDQASSRHRGQVRRGHRPDQRLGRTGSSSTSATTARSSSRTSARARA